MRPRVVPGLEPPALECGVGLLGWEPVSGNPNAGGGDRQSWADARTSRSKTGDQTCAGLQKAAEDGPGKQRMSPVVLRLGAVLGGGGGLGRGSEK